MTATLTPPRARTPVTARRPLTLLATLAGAAAAGATLAVCLAAGVIGWFVTDAGVHGEPRDGLRTGALGWLMAHGSGVQVQGVAVTAVPLGLTVLAAWVVWRFGLRLGESVAGHGPDAEALSDGDRDWTVPLATALFAAAYVVVAVVTAGLAGGPDTPVSQGRVVLWSLVLTGAFGGTAIASGSGRLAVWLSLAPASVRATAHAVTGVLVSFLAGSFLVFLIAFAVDFGAAMNVLSRLHTDTGDAVLFSLLVLTLVPNAVVFAGAYLLGPGFAVGTGTLVSPTVVAVGPVPMFPLLAALPDEGPTPAWTPALIALPVLLAAAAVIRSQRRHPTTAWDQGALRGLVAGVLAAVLVGLLAVVAGGAVGPGRMAEVGPAAGQVLVHAIVALGGGGLLGGLVATWRQRRAGHRADAS
jgi:hypothetical protein